MESRADRRARSRAAHRAGGRRGRVEEMEAACGRAQSALANAIDDPTGRWVLGEHSEARSEFAVSAVLGGELCHLVIDRTFVEDGVRWIID